jgi:hypothetical protein
LRSKIHGYVVLSRHVDLLISRFTIDFRVQRFAGREFSLYP